MLNITCQEMVQDAGLHARRWSSKLDIARQEMVQVVTVLLRSQVCQRWCLRTVPERWSWGQ